MLTGRPQSSGFRLDETGRFPATSLGGFSALCAEKDHAAPEEIFPALLADCIH
jgi:hypothetical protein